ncbi:MAG: YceI family protein [Bacteroidota bacterium]|nr:YceI family protein [Bacteroidota bacterium]
MKKITFILSLLVLSTGLFAQTTWKADPFHSRLGFTVTHLGIADVPGHFGDYDVTITASKDDFSDAIVEMTAQTASINTRVEPRDKHLKSADFFDVEKHPTMTFKSTSIKKAGKNKYKLSGDLTLRGITKPVTVDMLYRGTTANPNANGAPVAGIQIMGTIKRSDFGIGKDFPAPMISDQVVIKADGEFGKI